jgi:hypothetical protein
MIEAKIEQAVEAANEERHHQATDEEFGLIECRGFFRDFEFYEKFRPVDVDEVPAVFDTPAASSQMELFTRSFKTPEAS